MALVPGQQLGQYRLVERVGRGGMAEVWKAFQPSLARDVAVKVLPEFLAETEGFRERFRSEAQTIARLRHQNILGVFDYGEHEGIAYIVSEFVGGGTLSARLGQPRAMAELVSLLGPIASALDHAHAHGIIHRDLKPSNVLLHADGTPVLSDFGLARMLESDVRLTHTGTAVGTPEYMSPEQAMGETAGPASDRYALAVMAYEMLTGSVPFSADTPLATLLAHLHKPLPLPREKNPAITDAMERVLLKGLAKRPEDRYASASELVRELEAAAQGGVVTATAPRPFVAPSLPVAPSAVVRPETSVRRGFNGVALWARILIIVVTGLVLGFCTIRAIGREDGRDPFAPPADAGRAPGPSASVTSGATGRPPLPTRPPQGSAAAPSSPSSSAASPGTAIPGLGRELWTARFEAREILHQEAFPAGQAEVRVNPQGLELDVPATGRAFVAFRRPVPDQYVLETELQFGADVSWSMVMLRGTEASQTALTLDERGNLTIARISQRGVPAPLTSPRRIPSVNGRSLHVYIVATDQGYVVYGSDGREMLRAEDPEAASTAPLVGFAAAQGPGLLRVTKVTVYEFDAR